MSILKSPEGGQSLTKGDVDDASDQRETGSSIERALHDLRFQGTPLKTRFARGTPRQSRRPLRLSEK